MNMNRPKKKATFIATVRIDIKDLAKLAKFLSNRNIYVETRSKIASEALRIMARGAPDGQDITTLKQAVLELEQLGYSEILKQDSRYHGTLFSEIEIEKISEIKQQEDLKTAKEYMENEAKQLENKQNAKNVLQATLTQIDSANSPLALAGPSNLADIDQKSDNEAKQMRTELGQMPTIEMEGDEQNEQNEKDD